MKKHRVIFGKKVFWTRILLFFLALPFLTIACVNDQEMAYINDQIVSLKRQVTRLEENQSSLDNALGSDVESGLTSVRASQADTVAELDRLKDEFLALSGRVEDNERMISRGFDRDLTDQDLMKAELSRLSTKVMVLGQKVERQRQYLGLEPMPVPSGSEGTPSAPVSTPDSAPVATPVPAPAPPAQPPATVVKVDEQGSYDRALGLYREGKFEESIDAFKAFLGQYANSDRADNAQFWIGECQMGLKQYEQAILSYQQVIKKYPKGNKVPAAMLRQAAAFQALKDKTSTRLLLQKIIKNHPNSSEAAIAKKRLNALN
jgi:tol-pal system protein YbgF